MDKNYPSWICSDCGNKHGRRECGVATWHMSACDVCGQDNVLVTEPRDFGHLKDGWQKRKRGASMPKLSEEERWVKYRRNYLPGQLERARRRYIGLVREARRMNMLHLLTNKELYEVD